MHLGLAAWSLRLLYTRAGDLDLRDMPPRDAASREAGKQAGLWIPLFRPGIPGPDPACEVTFETVIKSVCTSGLTVWGGALYVELQVVLCLHDVR